jgi:hypothetical protein
MDGPRPPGRPGVGQQLAVLLQAQARGLLLELQLGDALAQRLQLALQPGAARRWRAAWRSGRRIRCAGAQRLLALQLQASASCRPAWAAASDRRSSSSCARCCSARGRWPAGRRFRWCAQLAARLQAALGNWPPAPGAPACAAARAPGQRARPDHALVQLGMALLLSASCMSSSSKRASAVTRRSCSSSSWRRLRPGRRDLLAARAPARPAGQAQGLDLQLVRAAAPRGLAARATRRCAAA